MVERPGSLSPALIAFLEGDTSLMLASTDAAGWPVLGRALACGVSGDGGRLTVLLAAAPNAALLAAVEETGLAALVVNKPSTHRSVQFKGRDAAVAPAGKDAGPTVARHVAGFARDVGLIGFSAAFSRTLTAHDPRGLAAVSFTPEAAFDQTPGPRAGDPVEP